MSASPAARISKQFFTMWLDHMHVVKRPVMAHCVKHNFVKRVLISHHSG